MTGWLRLAALLILGHVLAPLLPLVIAAEALALAVTIAAVAVAASRGLARGASPAGGVSRPPRGDGPRHARPRHLRVVR